MKRILTLSLSLLLSTTMWAVGQQPTNGQLPGVNSPINGQYSHAAFFHRQPANACQTCAPTAPVVHPPVRCESCQKATTCATCNAPTCNTCAEAGRSKHDGRILRRLWDWLTWRPRASECDWHTSPTAYHPEGWQYFKCYQGPAITGDCGPKARKDWSLHLRGRSKTCSTCNTCSECGAASCGPNGCAPAVPAPNVAPVNVAPVNAAPVNVAPVPQVPAVGQSQPYSANYRSPNVPQAAPKQPAPRDPALSPGNESPAAKMIPGFQQTRVQNTRYAPEQYPQPVPADYRLPMLMPNPPALAPTYPGR